MNILSVISEKIKGSVLFNGTVGGTGDAKGIKPAGSNGVVILIAVTMANAADLVLSLVTADDADGTTPIALTEVVPVFLENVRQASDAKAYTFTDADSVNLLAFAVPSILIPTDKYLCLSFANSNDANIISAIALDDVYQETGEA